MSYCPIGQDGWSWVTAGSFQVQNSPGTGLSPVPSETASASHLSPTTTLSLFSCIKEKSQIFYLAIFITFILLISIQVGNAYLKKKKKKKIIEQGLEEIKQIIFHCCLCVIGLHFQGLKRSVKTAKPKDSLIFLLQVPVQCRITLLGLFSVPDFLHFPATGSVVSSLIYLIRITYLADIFT